MLRIDCRLIYDFGYFSILPPIDARGEAAYKNLYNNNNQMPKLYLN